MEPPLLELDSVTKEFGPQTALAGLSARIGSGTIGLVGPNGAGKTTLLRLLLGLLPPTSGSLRVLGYDVLHDPLEIRSRVGYMPEHDCLLPSMTAVGFVAFMGQVSGLPRETALSRAHDVLQFVGLHEERYRRIREYSVGMRQRVKLAQAIVHDPRLCFLDEPTAGLDPKGREEMLRLLRILAQLPERHLVVSTHLLSDVDGLCDQILLMSAGKLLAAGPLAPLLRHHGQETVVRYQGNGDAFLAALRAKGLRPKPGDSEVRLTLDPGDETKVFGAAAESATQVRHLASSTGSVEELFLTLVDQAGAEGPR